MQRPLVEPVRRRRPPIFRVRTGCFTCRSRRKKCDEVKPVCAGCKRNKLVCNWPGTLNHNEVYHSADVAAAAAHPTPVPKQTHSTAVEQNGAVSGESHFHNNGEEDECNATYFIATKALWEPSGISLDYVEGSPMMDHGATSLAGFVQSASSDDRLRSGGCRSSVAGNSNATPGTIIADSSPVRVYDAEDDNGGDEAEPPFLAQDATGGRALVRSLDRSPSLPWPSLPVNISLFPGRDTQTFDLMGHYLSRTATSMGNGSTDVNPFISQLIPLSFANDFILQLILSQSAVHRAIEGSESEAVAQDYYNKSIRRLQEVINSYVSGEEKSPLWVILGALIMCFTETAKGDTNGVVFDHLGAVGPLLVELLSQSVQVVPADLRNFIVEYYIYTAAMSMISIDPTYSQAPFLNPALAAQGEELVASGYQGQLCGCWLELLGLIPQIFEFGRRSKMPNSQPEFPTADDFMAFSSLQIKVLAFKPPAPPDSEAAVCGYIFQQATHLYLLTSLSSRQSLAGSYKTCVEGCVDAAFKLLAQLSPAARINTTMIWALTVIGACITHQSRQEELLNRLQIMFSMIGLGNIQSTAMVLRRFWALPLKEQSPWEICRVMRDHQLWISLA